MLYDDVIQGRRSIRGFLKKPVPKELLEEILALAMRAPSSMNTQPWHFHVITGDPLDKIRAGNTERILAGEPDHREFRDSGTYEGIHRERQVEIAKKLFAAMGIERHDKEKRLNWTLRGFRQFDAPVSLIVTFDRDLEGNDLAFFDCGAVMNGIVNAAWSRGLGCVVNSQGIVQSPVVREHAGIPEDEVIMMAVAIGWPDDSFAANAVVSPRKPVDEAASFIGF